MAIQRNRRAARENSSKQSGRRAIREMFRKRNKSWFKKGNELAQLTGAEIFSIAHLNDKFFIYKSTDRPGWPPSEQEIINLTPPPFHLCPKDFETMNEEKDEDDDDDDEGEGGGDDRAQADEVEVSVFKGSGTQKTSEKIVDQRRVFTIPKPPVLRRSQIEGASRTEGR